MNATDKLDAIQARADAATPGPWGVLSQETIVTGLDGDSYLYEVAEMPDRDEYRDAPFEDFPPRGGGSLEDDSEFIAHARTDVPALVTALRKVLTIHQPGTAYGVAVCTVCSQVKDADEWDDPNDSPIPSWVPYPCDTLRAIEGALDA